MRHEFKDIEEKWQKKWADEDAFNIEEKTDKPKYYA